jgi:hypothetical protein
LVFCAGFSWQACAIEQVLLHSKFTNPYLYSGKAGAVIFNPLLEKIMTDRPQIRAQESEPESRLAAEKLREEFNPGYKQLEKDAQRIIATYDMKNHPGEDPAAALEKGTKQLSSELLKLSNHTEKYNFLLSEVNQHIPNDPLTNGYFFLHNWSKKTGSWSGVDVLAGDGNPAYRIAAEGNTFNGIVKDAFDQLTPGLEIDMDKPGITEKDYAACVKEMNHIKNINHIEKGQAIRLRRDFDWNR